MGGKRCEMRAGAVTQGVVNWLWTGVVNWLRAEGWPSTAKVVISYASGRCSGRDCDGAGPGMYYAEGFSGSSMSAACDASAGCTSHRVPIGKSSCCA
jgi:hypothetical protein